MEAQQASPRHRVNVARTSWRKYRNDATEDTGNGNRHHKGQS